LETASTAEQRGSEQPPSGHGRAAQNVLSNWFTYLVGGAVSFFLSPFIVRHLGNSAYGVWVLLVSLTGYLGFLDLGIRGAVTRYIARFHAQANHEEAGRTASSACGLFLAIGVIAILVSVALSVVAIPHFKIPPIYARAAQLVVVIAGVNVAVSLVSGVFGGIVVGLQRFTLLNAIALGTMALRTIAIVAALRSGRGLVSLALIQLGSTIAELVLGFGFSRMLYPELRIALSAFRWRHVSLIFSFGLYAFILQLANYVIFYTDALVIGAFLGVTMVTFFAIGGNLTVYARDLVGGVSRTMTPLASRLEVHGGADQLNETVLKAARYCTIVLSPIFVTFIIRGKSFIGLWMGPAYSDLSGHVLWILSVPWLFGAGTSVVASAVLGIGRHKPVVPIGVSEGLANLGLSIALVKSAGIVGVAWGTAIPNLAVSLLFWPWYIRRTMGIQLERYALSLWIFPALATLPFALLTYLVERLWAATSLFVFFVQVACVLPTMLLGFWLFGSTREERVAYAKKLSASLSRRTKRI